MPTPKLGRPREEEQHELWKAQRDALIALLRQAPPLRSIEDDRYQHWKRRVEATLAEMEWT